MFLYSLQFNAHSSGVEKPHPRVSGWLGGFTTFLTQTKGGLSGGCFKTRPSAPWRIAFCWEGIKSETTGLREEEASDGNGGRGHYMCGHIQFLVTVMTIRQRFRGSDSSVQILRKNMSEHGRCIWGRSAANSVTLTAPVGVQPLNFTSWAPSLSVWRQVTSSQCAQNTHCSVVINRAGVSGVFLL